MNDCDGIFPGAPCGAKFWHQPHPAIEPASPPASVPVAVTPDLLAQAAREAFGWSEGRAARHAAELAPFIRATSSPALDVECLRLAQRLEHEFVSGRMGSEGASVASVLRHFARLATPPTDDKT